MRNAFARALRKLRKARGLTQDDFSVVSSRTYLSTLERGKKSPTLDKVLALARILGVHPMSLLTLTCIYFDQRHDLEGLFRRVRTEIPATSKEASMIRILITDDHAIVREGLKQLFVLADDIVVTGEATSGEEAIARLDGCDDVDLLLLDLSMPGLSGKDLVAFIRGRRPELPILVLSMHIEPQIAHGALQAGANGYLTKDHDPETLLDAIRTVADGGRFIDPRIVDRLPADFS